MVVLALIAIFRTIFQIFKPKIKGIVGEKIVSFILSKLPSEEYSTIYNVMLSTECGSTQIDHVVVSLYGMFVIEVKNYSGWITGAEHGSQWVQTIYRTKNRFMNPIHQK